MFAEVVFFFLILHRQKIFNIIHTIMKKDSITGCVLQLRHVALVALFCLMSLESSGQALIRRLNVTQDKNSIIREVDYNKWMLMSYDGYDSYFYMVDDVSGSAPVMYIPYVNLEVKDFDVMDNWVYYCGVDHSGEVPVAAFGFFPLVGFPQVVAYHCPVSELTELKKIEVLNVNYDLHCVMIGRHKTNGDVVVDAMSLTTIVWGLRYGVAREHEAFDDIAVTDSLIVVTSVDTSAFFPSGGVWRFVQPTVPGGYMSIATADWAKVNYLINRPFLVESCYDGWYVVGARSVVGNYYCVGAFNDYMYMPTGQFSVAPYGNIWIQDYFNRLVDMKFCPERNTLDMLIESGYRDSSIRSEVYHLTPQLLSGNTTINGHLFYEEKLNSIDNLMSQPGQFVASGRFNGMTVPKYYRYTIAGQDNCFEINSVEFESGTNKQVIKEDMRSGYFQKEVVLIEAKYSDRQVNTICN